MLLRISSIFLFSIAALWLTSQAIPVALADELSTYVGTFNINLSAGNHDTFPGYAESNVPTNLINTNYHPSPPMHYSHQGVSFNYSTSTADTGCYPVASTFNRDTVEFKESAMMGDSSESLPLFTVSSNKSGPSISKSFALSATQVGFELKPHTQYTLRLKPDASVRCNGGDYMLSQQVDLVFTTGADEIAPKLYETTVNATNASAQLAWKNSDRAASNILTYGQGNYNNTATVRDNPSIYLQPHAIISNLKPATTYNYRIASTDQAGNTSQITGTFKTSSVSSIQVSDITGHEASVRWRTDPALNATLFYSTTKSDLNNVNSDTQGVRQTSTQSPATNHDFRLTGLTSKTTYYARLLLEKGNATSTSQIFSFKTLDASAGYSSDPVVIVPDFASDFDLSLYNFKDFPSEDEEASQSAQEASSGAVLASTDSPLASIAGNFIDYKNNNPWIIWLWIPILILIIAIIATWLMMRHEQKMKRIAESSK